MPDWPTLLSNGIVPLALVLLGLLALEDITQRAFRTTHEERILFLFIFLLVSLIVLTLTGIFFRGPGMALMWPWSMIVP